MDRMAAGRNPIWADIPAPGKGSGGRKVRAPQDMVMGNAHRPQGPGKCNRKQTASRKLRPEHCFGRLPRGKGETVR